MEKTKVALNKLYHVLLLLNANTEIHVKTKINFLNAINDDLNTPKAISILFTTMKIINRAKDKSSKNIQSLIYTIKYLGNIIGLLKYDPKIFLNIKDKKDNNLEKITQLIEKREHARKEKNWDLADKIRATLKKMKIKIEDKKDTTTFSQI